MKNCIIGMYAVKAAEGKTIKRVTEVEGGMIELVFTDDSNLLISSGSKPHYEGGADLIFLAEEPEKFKREAISSDSCANCGTELWAKDEGRCPACGGTES